MMQKNRIKTLAAAGWQRSGSRHCLPFGTQEAEAGPEEFPDLEILARYQVIALIDRKFKGHAMERLIESILKAQGYTSGDRTVPWAG